VFAAAISPRIRVHIPGAPYFLAALLMFASVTVAYFVARPVAAPNPHPANAGAASS
jgi:hypothetical protein